MRHTTSIGAGAVAASLLALTNPASASVTNASEQTLPLMVPGGDQYPEAYPPLEQVGFNCTGVSPSHLVNRSAVAAASNYFKKAGAGNCTVQATDSGNADSKNNADACNVVCPPPSPLTSSTGPDN